MSYKVMVVDDSTMMRMMVTGIVNKIPGFTVIVTAENGKKALELLATHKDLDIIVSDIEMPEMDGLEFLRYARLKSKAKIVILSSVAVAGSTYTAKAKSLGAAAIISKPSGSMSYDLADKRTGELTTVLQRLVA